ncbi:MAG: hypothetical protein U9O78_00190 [Patescibacteria group bacterium]|nr:hypothetical protein [Patescibacteria group bacterium]
MKKNTDQNIKLFLLNRKFLVLTIALVWTSFALIFFVIKPQISQLVQNTEQIDENRSHLKNLQQKLVELKQIRLSAEFEKKDTVDEVLPSHKPLLELLANLNQAAEVTKVSFTNFEISPGKVASPGAEIVPIDQTKTGYDSLELKLSVAGLETNVEEFLNIVEKIAPISTITELSIRRDKNNREETESEVSSSSSGPTVRVSSANMLLSTYYYTRTISTTLSKKLPAVGEEEIKVFDTIQKFRPSDFKPQTELKRSELEDIFGVKGLIN